jgi:hypothetical protein
MVSFTIPDLGRLVRPGFHSFSVQCEDYASPLRSLLMRLMPKHVLISYILTKKGEKIQNPNLSF